MSDVIATVVHHHDELLATLRARVDAVQAAARAGVPTDPAREDLHRFLTHELAPHARAEEDVLYAEAGALPTVGALVAGMLFEHAQLIELIGELGRPLDPTTAVAASSALLAVFSGHARRENELLLPALAHARPQELPTLVHRMHERFASLRDALPA